MGVNMLDAIIPSKTANKLLIIFVMNPEKRFYLRQLSRMTAISLHPIQIALAKLEKAGILSSKREANLKYYQINKKSPIYEDVRSIVLKTEGVGDLLREELRKLKNIKCAFIYGSLAKDKMKSSSDIDLCIIGEVKMDDLAQVVRHLEERLRREVSIVTFTPSEWKKKYRDRNAFLRDILKDKRIILIGKIDEI